MVFLIRYTFVLTYWDFESTATRFYGKDGSKVAALKACYCVAPLFESPIASMPNSFFWQILQPKCKAIIAYSTCCKCCFLGIYSRIPWVISHLDAVSSTTAARRHPHTRSQLSGSGTPLNGSLTAANVASSMVCCSVATSCSISCRFFKSQVLATRAPQRYIASCLHMRHL